MPVSSIPLDAPRILPLLQGALTEDIGPRDLTAAALIPPTAAAQAEIVARAPGVVAGMPLVGMAYGLLDPSIRVRPMVKDGDRVQPDKALAFLEGPARPILSGERTVLNLLSHGSGIATLTRRFVDAVKPYPAKILDTRKTTPGLRLLEKYAVAAGGGRNHRMGLYDQVLIKDNHLEIMLQQMRGQSPPGAVPDHAGMIGEALEKARRGVPRGTAPTIEIEVRDLDEFRAALGAGATLILLDHMPVAALREAVRLRRRLTRRVWLEASGGVTLATVAQVAATGVDYISVGAITRDAPGLDIALDIV